MPWCLRPNFLIWATPESCELFQQAPVKYSRRPDYPVAEILKYSTYSSFNWKLRFWLFLCKTFSNYTYSVYFSSLSIVGYPWKAALTKVKSYGRKSIFGKFYIVKRWHSVLAEKKRHLGKKLFLLIIGQHVGRKVAEHWRNKNNKIAHLRTWLMYIYHQRII